MRHTLHLDSRRIPRTHENRVLQAYGPELALCVRTCAERDLARSRLADAAAQYAEDPDSDGLWRQLVWAREAYEAARRDADRALAAEQVARLG